MRYAILGPVELCDGERRVAVEGRRQRGLLIFLLLHANRAVAADQLIEVLWNDQPPQGARKRLRMTVLRLRRTLEVSDMNRELALRTVAGGYVLDVQEGNLDVDVFEARVESGRRALDRGDAADAVRLLRGALELWRGPALAEVAYEDWAQPEIRRLEELRLAAEESRIDAELQLGEHAALVGELEALVGRHRTRERFAEQLMIALYRCRRQADALEVYQRTRAHLSAALGLEPGPRLRALQADVLVQAASLEPAADATERPVTPRDHRSALVRLPARPARLIGRNSDAGAVIALLRRHDTRLVTVMGTGGVGKTTLAIEVAHRVAGEFADGATFVDLSALADPAGVADSVLHALGRSADPNESPAQTLCRLAATKEQLLVLDNLEQLLGAAPLLAELLHVAPRLTLLVTSRAALDLRAEHRYRLDPLALPDSGDPVPVCAAPATALFIARARARDPAFRLTTQSAKAIAAVCSRVDGLPLAIELAAAHTCTLSPQEISRRLGSVLTMLGRGPRDLPARQLTLRATLDWSYEMLDEAQRAAFAKLSVFAGGCTIDAAQRVLEADLETLEILVDHSMLTRRASLDGTTRLTMLQPVREYAAELLTTHPDAEEVFDRHSAYYVDLAETTAPRLIAADQLTWQRRLDADADNFIDVLEREHLAANADRILRLAIALREWWRRGRGSAGRAWIDKGLGISSDVRSSLRADALATTWLLCAQQGDIAQGLEFARQALALYDEVDDHHGQTVAFVGIAVCLLLLGDSEGAQTAAGGAVRSAQDLAAWHRGYALIPQALTAPDAVAATAIAERAAHLLREAGDVRAQAWLYGDLGYRALEDGALDHAHELIERSLRLSAQLDDQVHHTFDIGHMALWALHTGDHPGAAAGLSEALMRCSRYGIRRPIPEALAALATIAAHAGHTARTAELLGAASALRADEPLTRIEERMLAQAVEQSQHAADSQAWERAYAAGCRRSPEDAIALGVETADDLALAVDARRAPGALTAGSRS